MTQTADSFGARLARLRQAAGLSQQALADRLSVTRQAVSNWERNQTLPDLEMLRAIAQALDTDLNTLCGAAAPKSRKVGKRTGVICGVLCLCAAITAGGILLGRDAPAESPASPSVQPTLAPHKVRYTTPDGITVVVPSDGWEELKEELTALPDQPPGPVEWSHALWDTLAYFARQYEFGLAPVWDGGTFSSWDQVLLWLYKAGISGGDIMETEQVDEALHSLFGPEVQYVHQSTERFPLTEEGYYPLDVSSDAGGPYQVDSFTCLTSGVYEAVLKEKNGPAVTLTFRVENDTVLLRSIGRTEHPAANLD